jgi:two-component system cell cycle response regulator DivK
MAGPLAKIRVLVVEDFDDTRELYADYLRLIGFEVCEARDGLEALYEASGRKPDVIMMDLGLPRLDGWEATRRIKQDVRTARVPVVAVTGFPLNRFASEVALAAFDVLLTKPCLPDDLADAIRRVLGSKWRGRSTTRAARAEGLPRKGRRRRGRF